MEIRYLGRDSKDEEALLWQRMENQHYEDKYRDPKGGTNIKHSQIKEIIVKGTEKARRRQLGKRAGQA